MNFNTHSLKLGFFLSLVLMASQGTSAKTSITVTQFADKTAYSNCRYGWDNYWSRWLGNGFKDMLTTELKKNSNFVVYERDTINEIYKNEHLPENSENDQTLKKGNFKKAKFTLVGAVTEFEYCASNSSTSVNVGSLARAFGLPGAPDLEVGNKGAKTKLGIDVRIINIETGEIVKTIHASAEGADSKFNIESEYIDHNNAMNSPMGEIARKAITKASHEIAAALD